MAFDDRPAAIFLTGPTAAGKTALALSLADRLPVEIISVDATQVYRGLDVGSAKPSAAELARCPHHLVDILDPAESYSAARFAEDAARLMRDICDRGRIPLLVGGTMLYFRVLREGLSALPAADPVLRRNIERQAAAEGWPALHRRLQEIDPDTAARLHPNHSQRIQRALEVYQLSGKPLSRLLVEGAGGASRPVVADYQVVSVAVSVEERNVLHRRIERRFRQMLQQGLIEEVEQLRRRPDLHSGLPAVRAVGYRQVWQYLAGETDRETMVANSLAATRQLAKRQYTWMRSWPGLHWLAGADEADTGAGQTAALAKNTDNCLKILQKGPIYFDRVR